MIVAQSVSETSVDLNHLPEMSARESVSEYCCHETFNRQCQLLNISNSRKAMYRDSKQCIYISVTTQSICKQSHNKHKQYSYFIWTSFMNLHFDTVQFLSMQQQQQLRISRKATVLRNFLRVCS